MLTNNYSYNNRQLKRLSLTFEQINVGRNTVKKYFDPCYTQFVY